MKKLALATCLSLTAPMACADFLSLYGGVGQWKSDYSGTLGGSDTNLNDLGYNDSNNSFFYIGFEHFIPLLPNVRLQHTNISSAATATLSSDFTLDGETFTGEVRTELDLTHTDAVLYYELLDNWISLDLGVALRKFDGFASAASTTGTAAERVKITETIPMVYGGVQFDVPFSGFYVGVDAYIISVGDNKITDYTAKAGYKFDLVAVDLGIELGYRDLTLEYDEDTTADLTFKGAYLGATLRF